MTILIYDRKNNNHHDKIVVSSRFSFPIFIRRKQRFLHRRKNKFNSFSLCVCRRFMLTQKALRTEPSKKSDHFYDYCLTLFFLHNPYRKRERKNFRPFPFLHDKLFFLRVLVLCAIFISFCRWFFLCVFVTLIAFQSKKHDKCDRSLLICNFFMV